MAPACWWGGADPRPASPQERRRPSTTKAVLVQVGALVGSLHPVLDHHGIRAGPQSLGAGRNTTKTPRRQDVFPSSDRRVVEVGLHGGILRVELLQLFLGIVVLHVVLHGLAGGVLDHGDELLQPLLEEGVEVVCT